MPVRLRRGATLSAAFGLAVMLNAAVALSLTQSAPRPLIVLALAPVALLVGALIVTSGSKALLSVALAGPLFMTWGGRPLPVGGSNLYLADVVVVLALGSWLFGRLVAGASRIDRPPAPRSAVTGWPLVLFGGLIMVATLRGNAAYGAGLVGQPLRLIVYASIGLVLGGITAASLHRLLVVLLYSGTVVTMTWAAYYIATGTSQTDQVNLSTGGDRILGISTTLYLAGALYLAILNLRLAKRAGEQLLHASVAVLAAIGVSLGYGRAVYAGVALVFLLLVTLSGDLRRRIRSLLPVALPFLALGMLLLTLAAPDVVDGFVGRVTASPSKDTNVEWRVAANESVMAQVREQPIIGVGFGRKSEFWIDEPSSAGYLVKVLVEIEQDPHNGYMFLLAGGGILTLGSFLLLIAVFAVGLIKRLRGANEIERTVLLWTAATLFTFLFNAASGTMFESPQDLLTIWLLLVLPAVVPLRRLVTSTSAKN